MTSTNTKLLLASTALVSAITVAGVAQAADITVAAGASAPTSITIVTDVNSDTNVDAGDAVATESAIALALATDSLDITAAGITATVSHTITGANNTDDALVKLTGASNTLNINAALDANQGTTTANAHGVLVSAASSTINVNAAITEGATIASADGINIGADVDNTTINVSSTGSSGDIDAALVTTATNTVNLNVTGGTVGAYIGSAGVDTVTVSSAEQSNIGSLALGAANDTVTLSGTDTDATVIGYIDGEAGTDTLTVSSGINNITTTVDNVETVNVSGGTLFVGTNLGATDLDVLTVASGAVLNVSGTTSVDATTTITGSAHLDGAIDLDGNVIVSGTAQFDGAADIEGTLNVSGTYNGTATDVADNVTVTGTFIDSTSFVTASDLTITGGTFDVTGTVGADNFVFNSGSFDATGALTIGTDMTVNSDMAINAASTVGGALNVGSNATLDLTADLTASGAMSVSGSAIVRDGATLTASTLGNSTNFDNVTIELGATTSGAVALSGAAADLNGSAIKVTATQGTTVTPGTFASVVQGNAGATAITTTPTQTGNALYTYTWAVNGNDYDLTVALRNTGVTTLAGAVTGNNSNVATTIDSTALASLYSDVMAESDTEAALESLTPDVSGGAGAASINTSVASTGTVSNRLALLRGTDNGRSGMVAGEHMMANREMWLQAFGTNVEQDERKGVKGFDATTGGFAIGVDTDEIVHGGRVGVAFAYAKADVDSDQANNAQTDIDTYQLTAYGSKDLANDMYVDGMISYAFNEHEGSRTDFLNDTYTADYDGNQFSVKGEVGKSYDWANTRVTPNFGLHYIMVETDDYTETGSGANGQSVDTDNQSALLVSLGADMEWNITGRDGSEYMPYLRAKYSYDAIGDEVETTSTFLGGGTAFTAQGADIARHSLGLGAGVNVVTTAGFEFTAGYDAEVKEDFLAHTGMLQARWSF